MKIQEIFELMIRQQASDAFIRANSPLKARIFSRIEVIDPYVFKLEDLNNIIEEIGPTHLYDDFQKSKGCEFTVWHGHEWRFRFSVFHQRGSLSIVVRKIDLRLPSFADLNLPVEVMKKFAQEIRGLILLTGITGSGKSTAIAALVQYINRNQGKHIMTIEEPIEFTFNDEKCIINQREIGKDVPDIDDIGRVERELRQ